MRKQLLKGFAMLMAVMAVAMVTAVASANGQTVRAKSNIPFEFGVADQTLRAGAYEISSMNASGDALKIVSTSSRDGAVRLTRPASGKAKNSVLLFHRYGERYFLAEVWNAEGRGLQLMTSKQERAIQKEMSRIAAFRGEKPSQCNCETVAIALAQ